MCCFKLFMPNPKYMSEQRFCCRKCSSFYSSRIRKGIEVHFTLLKILSCESCGIKFNQKDITFHKYCSNECIPKKTKKELKIHEASCEVCEAKFMVKNNLTAKYCSGKCRSKAYYRKTYGYTVKSPNMRATHGQGYVNKLGYKMIYKKGHPNSNIKTGIILEHIFIMSQLLGRPIKKGETIHHKNGVRSDNSPDNLEVWTSRHPSGVRVKDKIKSAIALLEEEGYKVVKE